MRSFSGSDFPTSARKVQHCSHRGEATTVGVASSSCFETRSSEEEIDVMDHIIAGRSVEAPYAFEEASPGKSVEPFSQLMENTLESIENYGRENPWAFGLWMMGIGFVVGWKLKIW